MRFAKKLFRVLFIWSIGILLFWCFCNFWIVSSTFNRIETNLEKIEEKDVALVLGTSKRRTDGGTNQYFQNRIIAAAELYKRGKVKHIILSGDNGSKYYNEPKDMLSALEAWGVPRRHITLDYAGFRTLDSVVRCKEVFGQENVIIITQRFHAPRSLFIANFYDMSSMVYVAKDPSYSIKGVYWRELFARVKAVLDLYLFRAEPKFLGKKEEIEIG